MALFKADFNNLPCEDVSDSEDEREKKAEVFFAISKGNLQKIVQLLDSGVQVNIIDRNNKDNTPLHYAIEKANEEIVEELLLQKWKTEVNAKNNKGDTPLHIAVKKDNKELVQLLLSKQVKIDIKNNKGDIPLDIAKRLEPERKDIIEILEATLDLKPQQLEYKADQQLSVHPSVSIIRQQDHSFHKNKNFNKDRQNSRRKQGDPGHGYIYQLKLLMLFLYRGVTSGNSFRLGTEIEEAKKFDDLVFEYTKDDKKKYRLLQAKHRLDESKKIMSENLLTEGDGDYSLTKYFFSYQDSKKEKLFKDGSIEDVTICTNIDLDFEDLRNAKIKIEKIKNKDDILDVESDQKRPTRYRFDEDVTLILKPKIKDYNLTRLARRLTECVLKSNPIKHHEINDVFKDYHVALAKDVIDIKNKKFHEKFINNENVSGDAEKFRNAIIKEIKTKSEEKLTLRNINEAIVTKRKVIDNDSVGLILSKNFGIGENKNWTNNAVSDDEIKDFLNHFVMAVNQPNEEELEKIIKDEIGEAFDLDMTENIFNKFFMKMLKWLQGKERGRFLSDEEGKEFFEEAKSRIPIWFEAKNPVDSFTGRKQESNDLHEKVQRSSESNNKKITVISQMTSISGLGGIGKTELARQYIHEHSNDYDNNIVWVNAESEATLKDSFHRLAQDKLRISTKTIDGNGKDIKSIVEEVYRFFTRRRSLFIFDNVDKSDDLKAFLPFKTLSSDNMPHILVTSRNQDWKEGIDVLNLNELNLEDAIEFVKKGLSIKEDVSQDQEIENLVEMLQCFPLALQQSVAHIREEKKKLKLRGNRKYTIGSYLEEYKKKKEELLNSEAFQSLHNDYSETTFTTWKVTTDKIKCNAKYGQLALKILDIIAYFAPKIIPVEILFAKLEKDNEKLWKAVELLNQYSMIKLEHCELDVHRLVKEVTRLNLGCREKEVLVEALKLFQDGSNQIDLFSDNLRLSNVDHVISVWSYANKHKELVKEFSTLPVLIVSELEATIRYQEADSYGSNALKLLGRILGDNHLSVLSLMMKVGGVLYTLGKDNDSLEIYRKLKGKSDIIYKQTKKIVYVDIHIGLVLNRQGKYDEALKIFSHLYSLVEEGKIYSNGNIEICLATTLLGMEKYDDAIRLYKNALQRQKEVLEPDVANILNTENNIAVVLGMQGKYDEAFAIVKEVYEKRTKIWGKNHPDTLVTYGHIANLLFEQMQYDEALRIANEVEKERENLFPNHPFTLKAKLLIVEILDAQYKYDEAIEKCKEVYEKRKIVLGPNHLDTLDTLDSWYALALKLAKQCKYDKAFKELNELLEERNKILKPNHPHILQTEDVIGKLQRGDINFKIADPKLLYAAERGQLKVVNELLSKDADVNFQNANEYVTPLHVAAQNGHARVVEKLLEKEANANAKTIEGVTALHLAAQKNNNLDVVIALLKRGAHVNCYATFMPLHSAVVEGNAKIVKLLLKNGANIGNINEICATPLHIAAFYKQLEVVKFLLERGANIDAVNKYNMKPSDITDDESIEKVLLSTKLLLHAIRRKPNQSNIQQFLEYGAVINYFSDTTRLTSLHYAVSEGNSDIVRLLLTKKPNVNVADEDGWTPLHYAAQDGHLDIVKLILDNGADPSIQNHDKKTPFQLAGERFDKNSQIYQEIKIMLKSECLNQQQE